MRKGEIEKPPRDFLAAVEDIKLAILSARARAARVSNVEALKLYFFVGGYISRKTRSAKWGTGAIDALSERLQVELPGLRGFSSQHIRFMRQFYDEWNGVVGLPDVSAPAIRYLPSSENEDEIRYLTSSKTSGVTIREITAFLSIGFTHHRAIFGKCKSLVAIELKKGDFHPGYLGQLNFYLSALDKLMRKPDENPTIGLLLCETVNKPVVQLAVQGYSQPIGIATYQALRKIPEPYKTLAPVIDGVRRVMAEHKKLRVER